MQNGTVRSGAWRSRWAAVGAAVAVTLGAGGMIAVDAASSDPSSTITVEPIRVLDTRTQVGLNSPPASGTSEKLQVTGTVPTQPPGGAPAVEVEVVPAGATAVILNATVVRPSTKGFVSIRPGDATGTPATSNINWAAGGANIANSVTVQLPTDGTVDIFVNGTVGAVLIDVAGYLVPATSGGPKGDQGEPGPKGDKGDPGAIADPPCFSNVDRYVDCGNGTVHDQAGGLIWLKDANCLEGFLPGGLVDYTIAGRLAAGVNDGECGLTDGSSEGDWRLPTVEEWLTVIGFAFDNDCRNPSVTDRNGDGCHSTSNTAGNAFLNVGLGDYWSSETSASSPSRAIFFDMDGGSVGLDPKTLMKLMWPVRGSGRAER